MKILVTGGHGFVGSALIKRLKERYPDMQLLAPSSSELNLLDGKATQDYMDAKTPDCVFHLAARLGGVGLVSNKPLAFLQSNLQINLNLLSAAQNVRGGGTQVHHVGLQLLLCGGRSAPEPGTRPLARAS